MRKFALYNRMAALLNRMNEQNHWNQTLPKIPDDELFSSLFTLTFQKLTDSEVPKAPLVSLPLRERSMDVYATHFLKTIIKIL